MWKLDCEKDSKDIVERNKNHIYFYSNVTRESIFKLNKYIREINIDLTRLQEEYNSNFSIYLHINSFGGVVFHALSCLEYIKNSKYPIITIIEGPCASAGTLISLMGSESL